MPRDQVFEGNLRVGGLATKSTTSAEADRSEGAVLAEQTECLRLRATPKARPQLRKSIDLRLRGGAKPLSELEFPLWIFGCTSVSCNGFFFDDRIPARQSLGRKLSVCSAEGEPSAHPARIRAMKSRRRIFRGVPAMIFRWVSRRSRCRDMMSIRR